MAVQFFKDINGKVNIVNSNTELNIDEFTKLVANIVDKGGEKHLPIYTITDNKIEITVGEILHPMEEKHFINFIYLETANGGYLKYLNPTDEPKATFVLTDDTPIAIYEYCNLHGLWKTKING